MAGTPTVAVEPPIRGPSADAEGIPTAPGPVCSYTARDWQSGTLWRYWPW